MARRLVLLRHAKSAWPDVPDHERPLAKRGRRDAPAVGRWLGGAGHGPDAGSCSAAPPGRPARAPGVGRWLGESGYVPDAVICSTAQRARQTWELVATGLAAVAPERSPVPV